MLDRILFWVVLGWMIVLLVLAIRAVREVWRASGRPEAEGESPAPPREGPDPGVPRPPGGPAD